MQLTRFTHSCVRLEDAGRALVVDPGIWSEPRALHGCDAVLVTHEHADHVDALRLTGLGVPVHLPAGAQVVHGERLDTVPVHAGEELDAAGFRVRAVGGGHATVLPDQQGCAHLGYVVDGLLYHPGDALHVPDLPVDTLLVPLQGAWLKTAEAIAFVRAVRPRLAVGIHDGQVNERGLASLNSWLAEECGTDYRWLAPGTSISLPA